MVGASSGHPAGAGSKKKEYRQDSVVEVVASVAGSVAVGRGVDRSCIPVGKVVGVEERVGVGGITIGFSSSELTWLQAVRTIITMLAIQEDNRLTLDGHSRPNNVDRQPDIIPNIILQFIL